jgi:phage gpG-like protein
VAGFTLEDNGELGRLVSVLERSVRRTLNKDVILFPIMRKQQERTELRYRAQINPDQEPWAPLAPSTIARKRRKGAPNRILVETGALFNSLRVQDSGPSSFDIVFGPEYGKYHNTGTRNMPKRSFLGFNVRDVRLVELQAVRILLREICGSLSRFRG